MHHPNLLEVFGLEADERGLFIVSEWIKGFSLQELLRVRRVLGWEETLRIAKPLAKVLDFAAERKLLASGVSLRHVFIEIPHLPEESVELQRTSGYDLAAIYRESGCLEPWSECAGESG